MLRLTLSQGEYFTVDGGIVVQLSRVEGGRAHVAVQAPREIPIVRGEVLERAGGKRPDGLISAPAGAPRGKWVFWDQSKADGLRGIRNALGRIETDANRDELEAIRAQLERICGEGRGEDAEAG